MELSYISKVIFGEQSLCHEDLNRLMFKYYAVKLRDLSKLIVNDTINKWEAVILEKENINE